MGPHEHDKRDVVAQCWNATAQPIVNDAVGTSQVCCHLDLEPEATRRLNFLKAPSEVKWNDKEAGKPPAQAPPSLAEGDTPAPPSGANPDALLPRESSLFLEADFTRQRLW